MTEQERFYVEERIANAYARFHTGNVSARDAWQEVRCALKALGWEFKQSPDGIVTATGPLVYGVQAP